MCESNAKSPYWPVNGIQCNTFEDWMEYGRLNDYNAVWVPLKRDLVGKFNRYSAFHLVVHFFPPDIHVLYNKHSRSFIHVNVQTYIIQQVGRSDQKNLLFFFAACMHSDL